MSVNNVIHRIRFTPKKYVKPSVIQKGYLKTEAGGYLLLETGEKIKI